MATGEEPCCHQEGEVKSSDRETKGEEGMCESLSLARNRSIGVHHTPRYTYIYIYIYIT